MKIPQSAYDFIQNKTCPYCQSKIKAGADFIVCPHCGTPHHQECWEENSGCTTYGCVNNPQTQQKVEIETQSVGHETVESIRQSLQPPSAQKFIPCPNCKSEIEESSTYCKFCGYNVIENKFDEAKEEFEKEYKKRYKDKIGITRKRFLITTGSFVILIAAVAYLFYLTVTKLNEYFSSDDYRIKNTVYNWKDSWEAKDIDKFRNYMTEDYEYFGKDGKSIDYKDRIRRMELTFKNYKEINIEFSDFKIINDTTTTDNDKKVQFMEEYKSDKYQEKGKKTLRLYKGAETNNEWKIYREIFE
ncbi:MAG: RING finger protein [Ignavibacteria bacterium]